VSHALGQLLELVDDSELPSLTTETYAASRLRLCIFILEIDPIGWGQTPEARLAELGSLLPAFFGISGVSIFRREVSFSPAPRESSTRPRAGSLNRRSFPVQPPFEGFPSAFSITGGYCANRLRKF